MGQASVALTVVVLGLRAVSISLVYRGLGRRSQCSFVHCGVDCHAYFLVTFGRNGSDQIAFDGADTDEISDDQSS